MTKIIHTNVGDQNGEKRQFVNEVPSNIPKQTEKKEWMVLPNELSHLEKKVKQVPLMHLFLKITFFMLPSSNNIYF